MSYVSNNKIGSRSSSDSLLNSRALQQSPFENRFRVLFMGGSVSESALNQSVNGIKERALNSMVTKNRKALICLVLDKRWGFKAEPKNQNPRYDKNVIREIFAYLGNFQADENPNQYSQIINEFSGKFKKSS